MTLLELECGAEPLGFSVRDLLEDRAFVALITQVVALATGVAARDIASANRRQADAARARQVAMYLAHVACAWPLARVAAAFGRDRSTVSYACQRVEELRDEAGMDALITGCEACVLAAPRRLGVRR